MCVCRACAVAVEDCEADLLVVGSTELSMVHEKIHLGSLALQLAEKCPPHVLIVKSFHATM